MLLFDEMSVMLDEIAIELPKEIFSELNGGINLLPDIKMHPKRIGDDFFVLGQYHHDAYLGRYIHIYYGSFMQIYARLPPEQQKEKLKEILMHEFIHHLESMAGERDLAIQDALEIERYRQHTK